MQPVKPAGEVRDFAKPPDWDDRNGSCGSLPVRRQVEGAGASAYLAMYSNWLPNSNELARLNAGYVVELCCCGVQPAVSVSVVPCADPNPDLEKARSMEAIHGAVARGWCHDPNREKEMDSDLALAISREVAALFGVPDPVGDPLERLSSSVEQQA